MTAKRSVRNIFLAVMLAVVFSIPFMAQTAYADEIDFSKYTSTYGYDNLATFDDGDDRKAVYDGIYDAYEGLWSSAEDLTTEYVADSGFYAIAQLDVSAYNLDTSDLLEIYIAFQFDNPIFYYAPTSFYPPTESSQTMTLVIDEDYIKASERTRLNALVMSTVSEYETAVASLTTDYDKMVAVHDKLLESMYYSYDDEGNPSDEAWAHNVVGSFDKGEGVCESYAKVYQLVMNALGYESIMVAGTSNGEGHVWNLVKLDGDYYYIDCTWDDTTNSKNYLLRGSYEFAFDHTNYTTSGSGETYQYALPQVSEDAYIKYLSVSCNGGTPVEYGDAKLAFNSMANSEGSYVINVAQGYNMYLPSGDWPTVKSIKIVGCGVGMLYATGDINANSDIVMENISFSTALSYILNEEKLAYLNLGNNSVTFTNVDYIGGYSYGSEEGLSSDDPGVNIVGGDGSQLVLDGYTDGRFLDIGSDIVNVDEFIFLSGSRCHSLCDELYANKLIFGSGLPTLDIGSRLGEKPGAVVKFKEIIVNSSSGNVESNNAYKGTTISLGDASGTGDLMIVVNCVKEDAYPNIDINNSEIDIQFRMYNMVEHLAVTPTGDVTTYEVWDDAINYNDGYLNVGNTSLDKISEVLVQFHQSNNGSKPLEVLYRENISILCDIDEDGNLYRKYNEKIKVVDGAVKDYIYYKEMEKTSVTIPDDAMIIDLNAFWGCDNMESVVIPEGLTHIYDGAFVNCGLTEITLPSTVQTVGEHSLGYNYNESTESYEKIDGFKIYCYEKYPAALEYAVNNGFDYEILPLPAMVEGVHQISSTANSITLKWDEVEGADGYVVGMFGDVDIETVGVVEGKSNVTYTVTGLDNLTEYYIYVAAYTENANNIKVLGHWGSVSAVAVPAASGLTYSERTTDSITLKWNEVEGAEGYLLEYYQDGAWTTLMIIWGSTTTEYEIEYLTEGTQYSYRVYAYKNNGSSIACYGKYDEESISTTINVESIAITELTYSGVTKDSVTLEWMQNSIADGYEIEQYMNGTWTTIKTISDNTIVSHKVTGLSASTAYSFRIRAYKECGDKIYGDYVSKSVITLPSAVSGFTYSERTSSTITLKWAKNASADGYEIQQYKNGTWTTIKTISGNSTVSYKITGLSASTAYSFRIRAYKECGDKIYGDYVSKSVITLPSAVSGFTYSERTSSTITLKWAKNASADGYEIQQYKNGTWTTIKTISGNSTVSYKITGLNASTAYSFRIRAYNGSGSSKAYSTYSSKSVKTLPSTVSGFSYSGRTASTVTLKWTKNTSADGYVIEQYKGGKWVIIKTITSNSIVSHKVTGLSPSVTYSFRIRAYKNDGSIKVYGAYATKSVKTLPSTINNFTYSGRTASTVTLKWSKNTSADGYVIQQYKGGKWVTIKTITKNSTLSYKVTGLSASKTYKFRIRAYKNDGSNKLYSASYTTKSVQTLPSAVKGFTYKTRTKTSITLKWTKNTSADGYVIQQYKGGKWVTIKTVTKNSTVSHKVTGLKKATTYKFRIRTYKKSGSTKLYASYTTKSIKTLS